MTRRLLAAATLTALVLAACGSPAPELDREPHTVAAPLQAVDASGMRLPTQFEGRTLVDPGWTTTPQHAAGIHLGAGARDGHVEISAVDAQGTVLWAAQRPLDAAGFAVTTEADGRALAVLEDRAEPDAPTTVTAYDLATGTRAWGPITVPGPHAGPGLVYGTGPRVALDPTTGTVAASDDDARVLAELDGTVLLVDDDALVARRSSGTDLWRTPVAEHGGDATALTVVARPSADLVLLGTSPTTGALLDLEDGTVLADARDAAVDPSTGTLVTLDGTSLRATSPGGDELWSLSVTPTTTIAALGGVLLYLRDGGAIRVHNAITGEVAQGYALDGQGTIIVPEQFTADGADVLLDNARRLLATVEATPTPDS